MHAEQGRDPVEGRPVAGAGGHGHHRGAGETTHHRGQGPLHAGDQIIVANAGPQLRCRVAGDKADHQEILHSFIEILFQEGKKKLGHGQT